MNNDKIIIENHLGLVHLCCQRFRKRGIDYEDIFLDIFCSYVHDKKCIMIQDVYNVINCYFIDNGLSNEMFIRLCGNIDKKREEYRKRNTIVYLERVR